MRMQSTVSLSKHRFLQVSLALNWIGFKEEINEKVKLLVSGSFAMEKRCLSEIDAAVFLPGEKVNCVKKFNQLYD